MNEFGCPLSGKIKPKEKHHLLVIFAQERKSNHFLINSFHKSPKISLIFFPMTKKMSIIDHFTTDVKKDSAVQA